MTEKLKAFIQESERTRDEKQFIDGLISISNSFVDGATKVDAIIKALSLIAINELDNTSDLPEMLRVQLFLDRRRVKEPQRGEDDGSNRPHPSD